MLRRKWWLLALAVCLVVLTGALLLTWKSQESRELPRGTLVWEVKTDE